MRVRAPLTCSSPSASSHSVRLIWIPPQVSSPSCPRWLRSSSSRSSSSRALMAVPNALRWRSDSHSIARAAASSCSSVALWALHLGAGNIACTSCRCRRGKGRYGRVSWQVDLAFDYSGLSRGFLHVAIDRQLLTNATHSGGEAASRFDPRTSRPRTGQARVANVMRPYLESVTQ